MKYKWQILGGISTAVLMWVLLILADALDEYVLDKSCAAGGIVVYFVPVALFIWYLIHCIRTKPDAKRLLLWHGCYAIVFLPLWGFISNAVNYGRFFIEQKERSSFMDLNGLEYMIYGFTALCLFVALCIVFHIIYAIVRKCRKNRAAA